MKIQFYLNEEKTETLISQRKNGESPHLTAKRLMEKILGGTDSSENQDDLNDIRARLEKLEGELKSLALQFSDRVYELSQKQTVDLSPLESRLSEIERRLDSPPSAAVPTPTRLPKATKRKTQETPENTP